MSRLYDSLRRLEPVALESGLRVPNLAQPTEILRDLTGVQSEITSAPVLTIRLPPASRLVALSDPQSLGAEKFRALATRLENVRFQREMKSMQVTSSVINEGKSLVAANLALTLAQNGKFKVLLIEGDLHRPTQASLFGLKHTRGLNQWWSSTEADFTPYVSRLNNLPLWFLESGGPCERPSDILHSNRFVEAFRSIVACFDWIVVDSTPMSPIIDVNLWSRLVDGTLLVVREGVTPVKALKKGLENLDSLKLIGVVLNESSEFDRNNYKYSYYGSK